MHGFDVATQKPQKWFSPDSKWVCMCVMMILTNFLIKCIKNDVFDLDVLLVVGMQLNYECRNTIFLLIWFWTVDSKLPHFSAANQYQNEWRRTASHFICIIMQFHLSAVSSQSPNIIAMTRSLNNKSSALWCDGRNYFPIPGRENRSGIH